jgi:hypothetical protein
VTTGLRRLTPLTACLTIALMAGACDTPSPAPPVKPSTQAPAASEPPEASPTADPPALEIVGAAPDDLHDVDWPNTPAPGEVCGVPGLVQFDADGTATATSTTWGLVRILRGKEVLYGDTDGDHRDEAAVYVGCLDNGATQNGQIAAGYVIYTHAGGKLAAIGTITPRQTGQYPTALARVEFAPGRIIAHEKWYRPGDPHCCPGGDATTVWTRKGNRLTPGDPRITS